MRRPSQKANSLRFASRPFVWAAFLLSLAIPAFSEKDPLASLIVEEKAVYEEWLASAEELPPALLTGTGRYVDLYFPEGSGDSDVVCRNPDLLGLLDANGGEKSGGETRLNFSLPRVREMFGESCLLRPGDRLMAFGPDQTEERIVSGIVLRRIHQECPEDAPFVLSALLDRPVEPEPLLFMTGVDVSSGVSVFRPLSSLAPVSLPDDVGRRLSDAVSFPEDFSVQAWEIPGASSASVIVMTRTRPGTDDDGLPSQLLLVTDGVEVQALWTERVDLRHGTGSFSLLGVSDFNRDGLPELLVDGMNRRCAYRAGFSLGTEGWAPLPLPLRRCGC